MNVSEQSTHTSQAKHHEAVIEPVAGPKGFRFLIVGLTYPMSKSGNPGDPIMYFGSPKRRKLDGPFTSKADAEAALSKWVKP